MSDSEDSPVKKRRSKSQILESSSSSDEESDVPIRKRKARHWRLSTTSSSGSEESIIVTKAHKRLRVLSDNDSETSTSSSSDSEVNGFFRQWASKKGRPKTRTLPTDSDCSDGSIGKNNEDKVESGSQSSDSDEIEKCIICFKALRGVVAHPSGCRHNFHSECLLTWSKTSNTCPIDRVKYTEVIVTRPEGDIVTRHEVKTPPPQDHNNDIEPDDPTFCEICHQHDREHEMLLCDRCEAGYHLNCLDPPLAEVPLDDWYCPDCARHAIDDMIDDDEITDLLRGGGVLESRLRNQPPAVPRRVGPRTRAAQRVIASIRQMAEQTERYQPSSSTSRPSARRTRKNRKSHRRRSTHYKVELITVEDGSTIEVKVAVNTRTRRKKKRKSNTSSRRGRKSYSKRSSAAASSENIYNNHRSSIQPLDIFGSRPQLEYFSGCEAEDELEEDGGLSVLRARSSVTNVHGMANRKQIAAQLMRPAPRRPLPRITVSSAPPDLLSSILEEQTKWHSPNAVIHSNSNGEVKVVLPTKSVERGVRKAAGNGETSGGSPPKDSRGGNGERSGGTTAASSSVPPLQPPPQPPLFSRVYEEEDFDLYADIEPPRRLAPPPEPPALLLALDGDEAASSPEDAMLVIDDRQTYDPDLPTSPPPSPESEATKKDCNKAEKLTASASEQMAIDLSSIRLPSPEPDIDDCPNRVLYSETSINIAKEKEDSDGEIELANPLDLVCKLHIDPKVNNNEGEGISSEKSGVNNETEDEPLKENDSEIENTLEKNTKTADEPMDHIPNNNSKKYDPESTDEDENDEVKGDNDANDNITLKDDNPVKVVTDVKDDVCIKDEVSVNDSTTENKDHDDLIIKEDPIEPDLKSELLKDCKENGKESSDQSNDDKTEIKLECENETLSEAIKLETEEKDLKPEIEKSCMEEGELKEDEESETKISKLLEEGEGKKEALKSKRSLVPTLYDSDDSISENLVYFEKVKDTPTDGDEKIKSPPSSERTLDIVEKKKENETSPENSPLRKVNSRKGDQEGEDVLELGCEDEERDGLVDITDEEISTYEKSWELEDNQATNEKTAGLEGLETEAISEGEDNMAEEGQVVRVSSENGPKEEGEIISDDKRIPVAWKKASKAKERSYREKDTIKEKSKKKEKKPKEKRKELERYDVRKLISEKPKKRKVDEFGRDISPSRSDSDSWSRSRSKSRSKSLKSRRTRSRSRSRSKKRRSRERRSKNRSRSKGRSRARSRPRSRDRSRDRSKRRGRSVSRSRSGSRKRKSRSPRKKERRSRAKSREKKRRKRDSSFSCSSCSCSSCERERRKSKKLTVIVPNDSVRKDKKKSKYKDRGELKRRRVDSPIPSKEVFTSGDNILVSVNFKSSKSGEASRKETSKKKKDDEAKKKKDKGSKENQPLRSIVSKSGSNQQTQRRSKLNAKNLKPVAIIDLAQSPFREQTLSPKEVIVLTDSESEDKRKTDENSLPTCQITGPKTPPEPHIKFNIINSKPQMLRSLANPLLDSVDQLEREIEEEDERVELPHKGPNTPPEPPVPYDPFEPTKSRSPTPLQELEESCNPPTPPIDNVLPPEPPQRPVSPPKPPPEPPKTPSPLHSPPPKPPEDNAIDKVHIVPPNIINDDSDMDIVGGDSPYSPGSSDGDDIFEPPMPLLPLPISKSKSRPVQKLMPKHTPSPLKRKPGSNKTTTPLKNSKGSKKEPMSMKLDEDQLKILDDLPNSAVEMQVKDKFLKKLNRQERVVEEVKMVLKPHYAKKHVNKEEYKEILRKSVPKICHSRSGEINPIKIQRLIEAYVKRYRHLRKKKKMAAATFSAPESLLKPKPKPTMWC